jgi:hypothetical protein
MLDLPVSADVVIVVLEINRFGNFICVANFMTVEEKESATHHN